MLSGSITSSQINAPKDLWEVEVDENQMRQVFTSLLENAREAMVQGRRNFDQGRKCRDELKTAAKGSIRTSGRYVKVVISDEGMGISEENMPNIFDPYFSTKYRGSQKGMGFGLAIAHSVIKKHNGHIKVESIPGKGTTVSILIPAWLEKAEQLPAVWSIPIAQETNTGDGGRRDAERPDSNDA